VIPNLLENRSFPNRLEHVQQALTENSLLALSVPSDCITNDLSSNGYFASNQVILFSESTETNQISSGKNTVLTAVQLLHKRRFDGAIPHDDSRNRNRQKEALKAKAT
jgi:hypothetical protein